MANLESLATSSSKRKTPAPATPKPKPMRGLVRMKGTAFQWNFFFRSSASCSGVFSS